MFKDIYLVDIDGLAKRLREASIEDTVALKNFMIFVILFSSAYQIPISINASPSEEDPGFLVSLLMWSILAVINYYGLKVTFRTNNNGDGNDFFKRFSALSLPVSVVTTLYFIVVMLCVVVVVLITTQETELQSLTILVPAMILVGLAYLVTFYVIMNKSMRVASGNA